MITKTQIKEAVENSGLIQCKNTSKDGVYVLKYKNKVFYKGLWDSINIECRGTVVDDDYNVIARPFTKIFNYKENNTTIEQNNQCLAVEKINGFMASATWYNDELLVSTTGTIDSDYAKLAYDWVKDYQKVIKDLDGFTFIFEIVDPADPHIIKEEPGIYLLGIRKNDWNAEQNAFNQSTLDTISFNAGFKRPDWFEDIFGNILNKSKTSKREGFVVYDKQSQTNLKLKTPYYLVTKFLARMNDEKLIDRLSDHDKFKKNVDEEFYGLIDCLYEDLDYFSKLSEQDRISYIEDFFIERSEAKKA